MLIERLFIEGRKIVIEKEKRDKNGKFKLKKK